MRYLSVAMHYPKPEHVDDLLGAMKRLGEALQTVPGLLDASAWKDSVSGRIVAISTWESRQAFLNARPVIGETIKDVPFDEWEAKPRELFNLDEIEERAIGRMKVYMRAIVYHTYGSPNVLELKEIEKPTPKDDEVLIKVQAASVNALDWHLLSADIFLVRLNSGLTKPKLQILGADIAGTVEEVGRNIQQLHPGDEVFGDIFDSGLGGFAEY